MKAERGAVGGSEFGLRPVLELLAEKLQIVLPLMLQEHLGQELNSMKAAEREAEQLLRVREEVLVLEEFGF
jgi:hypothetical protein